MNPEVQKRRQATEAIMRSSKAHVLGILGCGSVFHNPDAVTSQSDVDLVAVARFDDPPFLHYLRLCRAPYRSFDLPQDVNVVDAPYQHPSGFDVHRFFWDFSFFTDVSSLHMNVCARRLLSLGYGENLQSARLMSLRGEQQQLLQRDNSFSAGRIVSYPVFNKDTSDFYVGTHSSNLLMKPEVLYDPYYLLAPSLVLFQERLRLELQSTYGVPHSSDASLCNTLPKKIISRLSPSLREYLEDFF